MPTNVKTPLGFSNWLESDYPARADFVADNQLADELICEARAKNDQNEQGIQTLMENFTGGKANQAAIADYAVNAGNGVGCREFSIVPGSWTDSSRFANYPVETVIPIECLSDNDDVLVLFDVDSVMTALNAGIADGMGQTLTGGVTLYAANIPSQALNGTYTIIHREVQ